MEAEIYKPSDTRYMTDKYKVENGGICGQACLAVITKTTIRNVLREWEKIGLEFKGWSGWKQLRQYLESKGFSVKQESSKIEYNPELHYIARVQWFGEQENKEKPYYGWKHWAEASANTHFIVIHNSMLYCNEDGVFPVNELQTYLNHCGGCITSHFKIQNGQGFNPLTRRT